MAINKEKRYELFLKASEETKTLYGSEGALLRDTANQFGIKDEEKYTQFVFCIGDIILGLYKKTSFGQLLKDRLNFTDDQIAIAIKSLKPLLDKIPESEIPTTPNTVINIPTGSMKPTSSPTTLQPLRTFADDVGLSRAHGYGAFRSNDIQSKEGESETIHRSSQDDIIGK